ncbi:MAG: hypothetical protein ACI9IJ_000893, partial [Psychromonas sp.]
MRLPLIQFLLFYQLTHSNEIATYSVSSILPTNALKRDCH